MGFYMCPHDVIMRHVTSWLVSMDERPGHSTWFIQVDIDRRSSKGIVPVATLPTPRDLTRRSISWLRKIE